MGDKITLYLTPEILDALQKCYEACTARLGRPPQNMAEMLDLLELLAPAVRQPEKLWRFGLFGHATSICRSLCTSNPG
jgi:hypothetical protein